MNASGAGEARTGARLDARVFDLDWAGEIEHICIRVRGLVADLRRRGAVVALSGDVDSAVCLALAARSLGAGKVLALVLAEDDSDSESTRRGHLLADEVGVAALVEDLGPALQAVGCHRRREAALRQLVPGYGPGWRSRVVPTGGGDSQLGRFDLVVESPEGGRQEIRLPHRQYLELLAAHNLRRRVRNVMEYHHADRLDYAVIGTPNRLEYERGLFASDGGVADIGPVAHLYETQVLALARRLGLPEEICRTATPGDGHGSWPGRGEFGCALPWERLDLALWAFDHRLPARDLAAALGLTEQQADHVYRDIATRREDARRLHARPLLVRPPEELETP
jgi:NAD+ synthase